MLNLIFALIHVKLDCYERVCHGAPSGQAEGNNDDLIEHPGATRDACLSPTQKSKTKSQQRASPGGQCGQASASAKKPNPKVKACYYEMRGHIEQAVDTYLELSG